MEPINCPFCDFRRSLSHSRLLGVYKCSVCACEVSIDVLIRPNPGNHLTERIDNGESKALNLESSAAPRES